MSLAQLSQLLPLPEDDLKQVLDYAATLSKTDAAAHFSNLLGDSPLAIDFISSFNSRRQAPPAPRGPLAPQGSSSAKPTKPTTSETIQPVPKSTRQPKKKKAALHTPEARKVDDYAGPAGKAYSKKDADLQYIPQRASAPTSNQPSRSSSPPKQPSSSVEPAESSGPPPIKSAPPPAKQNNTSSTGGYLISDPLAKKGKAKSTPVSRTSTPKPAADGGNVTKVSITGGTPMAGQSTALADLDAAIRSLEITTNPTLGKDVKARRCNCVATKHPLQAAAPNCLSCGKVICLKEGLGPCTFCGTPLLSSEEIQAMVRELKDERGRERMAANAAANRRADVAKTPAPFTQPRGENGPSLADAAAKAREHRDKLLNFQAQNARRTTVRDEAADFDVTGAMNGTGSMWASPEERARELKRQQKLMREMEWNARPEYEKRQQVVSIDLAGRRVVRTVAAAERPVTPEEDGEDQADTSEEATLRETSGNRNGGAFSANPLLGAVMRPVYDAKGKGAEGGGRGERKKGWRRVQDDLDDNEGVILDGGIYGHHGTTAVGDEPECG